MNQDTKLVNISDIVQNQIPEFIIEDNPNFVEFLEQYYISQEFQGGVVDLAENLSQYKNFSALDSQNLIPYTELTSNVEIFDDVISVTTTKGYPQTYGLIKINDEIITYTGITTNTFTGCIRGFSGVDSLNQNNSSEFLVFKTTEANDHTTDDLVYNLSNLFLVEFFKKLKTQFSPGFEEIDFDPEVNPQNFISKVKTFYQSKGTDESYKILFKVLYGEPVKIIKPIEFCFTPSDDSWVVTETFICDLVSGNPYKLTGQTLYQDSDPFNPNIFSASGSIYEVESFRLNNETYYKLRIFSGYSNNLNPKGSISGIFVPTYKTYAVENVSIGSTTIFVDSTVGFAQTGRLVVGDSTYTYSDKTNNQFLNVVSLGSTTQSIESELSRKSEVYSTNYVYSYENGDITKEVVLTLNNVISKIDSQETLYAVDNDPIKIDNIGNVDNNVFVKSLIFNHPISIYSGKALNSITPAIRNSEGQGFAISNGLSLSKYNHNLRSGDTVNLFVKDLGEYQLQNSNLQVSANLFNEFTTQQILDSSILGKEVLFRRNLKKTKAIPFTRFFNDIQNKYTANIQDAYSDNNYNYITSNGLPSYEINPYTRQFEFIVGGETGATITGPHNFITGESVKVVGYEITGTFRNDVGISTGNTYFISKLGPNVIGLSENRNSIGISSVAFFEYNIEDNFSGSVSNLSLISSPLFGNNFTTSKIFKKIPKVVTFERNKISTNPGPVGIFVNGVEIQNYKSFDYIYFGKIENVDILDAGIDYSLVTPPKFRIFNNTNDEDTETVLIPQMKGELKGLVITNPGYDYQDVPTITIDGGNNEKVSAQVKMKNIFRELEFNSTTKDTVVNTVFNEFRFKNAHGFITGEEIVYETFGTIPIGIGTTPGDGTLLNNGVYYAVNIGAGTSIKLATSKEDAISGSNPVNIRTTGGGIQQFKSLTKIQIISEVTPQKQNLNFEYKKLSFGPEDINIYDNIFTSTNHGFKSKEKVIITVLGTYLDGATPGEVYFIDKLDEHRFRLTTDIFGTNILNILSVDFATTYFVEYPPIQVTVNGKIKNTSSTASGFQATIVPVVEGYITGIEVQRGLAQPARTSLGSRNTINFHKHPRVEPFIGSDATFFPIIEDGRIIDVIVKTSGQNYFNNFELKVFGQGYGAIIFPEVTNGQITDVTVVSRGVGYAVTDTTITVLDKGKNLNVKANLTEWNINEVTRLGISNLSNGVLFGKRYSLFGNVFGTFFLDSNLQNQFNINQNKHSPIIGWAYDGCPIYGPYAQEKTDGSGQIVRMRSGYVRNKISPPTLDCIEDYVFTNTGTLDIHNGRFCVTPEYPDGIYAYFCTVDSNNIPQYPYVIGNTYNNVPAVENFQLSHNQDLNFNNLGILKYTKPYRVDDKSNYYEYFRLLTSENKTDALITSASTGKLTSIDIEDGGQNYEVGDQIKFTEDQNQGLGAFAVVDKVLGVGIVTITSGITTFIDVKFRSIPTGVIGVCTITHNFSDQTFVSISGISTSEYSFLEGFRKINVEYPTTKLILALPDTTVTGIITGIQVKSPLSNYNVDDKLKIGNETLNVIGIDVENRILNVLREPGSPGYAVSTIVSDSVNKFTFSYNNIKTPIVAYDDTYYFNPTQSISLGVSASIGVGNTLTIFPLGLGKLITQFVDNGGILLPNNKFIHGEQVTYTTNQSTIVSDAGNLDTLPDLYVVKLSPDVIGLVQDKKDINNRENILRYNAVGTGNLHNFKTNRNVLTGVVSQCTVNVSTASSHGLAIDNNIEVNVVSGITTTYNVGYSSATKRVTINSQTNPKLDLYSNEIVVFDTTSPSLVGKDFNLYTDDFFGNPYFGNQTEGIEVIKTNASLTLQISNSTPKTLYYNLTNITTTDEIYPDTIVNQNNTLKINDSRYEILSKVIGITTNTFKYNLPVFPERFIYSSTNSSLNYYVLDSGVKGAIQDIRLLYGGSNYKKLPSVSKIISTLGKGANLFPLSNEIGRIKNIKVLNTETTFPTDITLSPVSKVFSTIKLKNNFSVGSLTILDPGRKYLNPPTIKLYNRTTNTINNEFSAIAILKNTTIDSVRILDPTSNLKSTDDELVVINNSNGIKILNATVTGIGPFVVSLTLETPLVGFSTENPLPINVGDEIFIENIISAAGSGFNSEDYTYTPFIVTFTNPNLGSPDSAVVRYEVNTFPGVFDTDETYDATIINYDDILKITPTLIASEFYNNELISNSEILNNIENDPITNIIKLHDSSGLLVNDIITGNSSNSRGTIFEIENFQASFKIDSSVSEIVGWKDFRGNLSSIVQKLQNNDYYQNFSYSLKSRKSFTDWTPIISDLAHVSGYKQFGDLSVESKLPVGMGSTLFVKSDSSSTVNIILTSEVDVNTISNFDLVVEEDIDDSDGVYSEYLKFGTKKLSNFILSSENRVLSIDDISNLFDTDNSPFVLVPIDTVDTSADSIVLKYFLFVAATVSFFGIFTEPQVFDLFVTRNNNLINLTSYAYYYNFYTASGSVNFPLGTIIAETSPTNGNDIVINFSPRNIFNSYSIRAIKDVTSTAVGVATTSFGYVKSVEKTETYASTATPSTDIFYTIPLSECTSGTALIGISSTPKRVENAFELSFVKDVNNIINVNVYAEQVTRNLGVFGITTSGGDIQFTFTPPVGLGVTVFTNLNLLTNTYVSENKINNQFSSISSELLIYSGSSPVSISTIPQTFAATKYVIEIQKSVGLSTQRSIVQINSTHFEDYDNNTVFGIVGDLNIGEINFETIYNPSPGEYILTFNPTVSANYTFKIISKSILSPNI